MPAISYTDTAVVDKPWDGPGNESRIATPVKSAGSKLWAWYDGGAADPDGDGLPDAKGAYKLPHHEVDSNGNVGPANVNGVRAALSRLNQSDTQIPDGDKAAVRAHLQKHLDKSKGSSSSSSSEEFGDEPDLVLYKASRVEAEAHVWAMRRSVLQGMVDMHGEWASAAAIKVLSEQAAENSRSRRSGKGVAIVPLQGTITPKPMGLLSLLFGGGGGLQAFRKGLQGAVNDPDVGSVVLDIDSPGGIVDGVPETAAFIRQMRGDKPIVAVANGQAASAAYWLASQADELVVTPSGSVGSVGVYNLHRDISQGLADRGIKPTLVSAGKYKVEGNPFEPLGDEARADIQREVNSYYQAFVSDVAEGRGIDPGQDETSEGTAFGGGRSYRGVDKSAVRTGLADRVDTLEATVRRVGSAQGRGALERRKADEVVEPPSSQDDDKSVRYTADELGRLAALRVAVGSGATSSQGEDK